MIDFLKREWILLLCYLVWVSLRGSALQDVADHIPSPFPVLCIFYAIAYRELRWRERRAKMHTRGIVSE